MMQTEGNIEIMEELGIEINPDEIVYIGTVNDGYCLAEIYYLNVDSQDYNVYYFTFQRQ